MARLNHSNAEQGIILPIALLALLVMMIASVAIIRSTDTSQQVAGKLAFKQDAVNQAERASAKVKALFESGALSVTADRDQDQLAQNYYASLQQTHESGLPQVLMDTSQFDSIFGSNNIIDSSSQITVRYLVERLCFNAGAVSISNCMTTTLNSDTGGDAVNLGNQGKATGSDNPIYRLSVRVTGPLNTNAFMQSEYSF